VLFSGETRGPTRSSQRVGDTGITALYLGPGFRFSWGINLGAEIAADLPVLRTPPAANRSRLSPAWRHHLAFLTSPQFDSMGLTDY
jgi:hypothetical protein